MVLGWGRKKENPAANARPPQGANAVISLRDKQISALLADHPHARSINAHRSSFDIPVTLRSTPSSTIRVTLPASFPQSAPVVTLFPRGGAHPALDPATGLLRTPLLDAWGPHDHLGRVISDLVRVLRAEEPRWPAGFGQHGHAAANAEALVHPPAPPADHSAMSHGHGAQRTGNNGLVPGPPSSTNHPAQRPGAAAPTEGSLEAELDAIAPRVPSRIVELESYPPAALERIANDPEALAALAASLEPTIAAEAALSNLLESNVAQAKANSQEHARIMELMAEAELCRTQVAEIDEHFAVKRARQLEILDRYSPKAISAALERTAVALDADGKELEAKLASGTIGIAMFVSEFQAVRARRHKCTAMREALLRAHPSASTAR